MFSSRSYYLTLITVVLFPLFSAAAAPEPVIGNDDRPMLLIPEATFVMGSSERADESYFLSSNDDSDESPPHPVLISSYYIDQYEVTVYDYQQYIAETNKEIPKHGGGIIPLLNKVPLFYKETGFFEMHKGKQVLSTGEFRQMAESMNYSPNLWTSGNPDEEPAYLSEADVDFVVTINPDYQPEKAEDIWLFNINPDYPVVSVEWQQAMDYCRYYGKRLPTEAEWEYAARGGNSNGIYPWGDASPAGKAVFRTADAIRTRPEVVGSFEPNGWGLYDMAGNVWEWVADWYSNTYYDESYQEGSKVLNPYNNVISAEKVIRGGGWTSVDEDLRVTNRNRRAPNRPKLNIGFRCAVTAR